MNDLTLLAEDERTEIPLDFDPNAYDTCEAAATALHAALERICRDQYSQNPEIELFLHSPEQSQEHIGVKRWHVSWEAGPWEWAIRLSFAMQSEKWWVEPYWSFSLTFEDKS